jgi:hypothetical protein
MLRVRVGFVSIHWFFTSNSQKRADQFQAATEARRWRKASIRRLIHEEVVVLCWLTL